jgi:mono/diheme cytochrome c family protein
MAGSNRRIASGLAVALAACLVVTSCATPRQSEPRTGAFRPANAQQARGETVFFQYCSKCHVAGHSGLGPGILPVPNFLIRFQVRHGLGVMPAFSERALSDAQLDDLIAYLDAIRDHPATVY